MGVSEEAVDCDYRRIQAQCNKFLRSRGLNFTKQQWNKMGGTTGIGGALHGPLAPEEESDVMRGHGLDHDEDDPLGL